MKKKFLSFVITALMATSLLAGCGQKSIATSDSSKKIKIGVAISSIDDKWLSYLVDSMKKYADTQKDVEVIYVDGKNDSNKQLSQIENFITQGVDAIIVNPVDTDTSKPLTDKAKQAKVPIISVNNPLANTDDVAAHVSTDPLEAGKLEMEYLAKKANFKGNVAIMTGTIGQEAVRLRTQGFRDVIAKYPNMKIVAEQTAEWTRAKGMTLMENWLQSGKQIDIVAANNDEMAIGALKAIEAAGKLDKILVGGIDGTPDALDYVKAGKLNVTIYTSPIDQGKAAVETAIKVAKGEKVEKKIMIPLELVDLEDVDKYMAKWKK
ncbi:sugar ABC transporter substrate-binding protein [Clostridium sp. DJ247]|uniref:sugar ABC transporter substrate-binding protein n=1 Tax=Clostridium sp. DJ247 TaxID=2726188 RepID=UPI0016259144|nr:sugar ABC transporter substrate-binding protein [Clostridium sp. DJ247]MBC2580785.1 sugar ABC transporter substrate-binding protein [Clostridium sp. DJ247]